MNNATITGTQSGTYLWSILICVKKESGYGGFSVLMPYPPTGGRTLEFYGTPEGDFSGTIIKVHESVQFVSCDPIKANYSFGLTPAKGIEVQPSVIEFQVWIDVTKSSVLKTLPDL